MGLSLGGSLAVSAAGADPRIKSMSVWSAAEATWYQNNQPAITHFPPTIMIHGQNDPLSKLADAYALQSLLQRMNVPCELDVYPNEGHAFNPTDQNLALAQTLKFFQQYP